MVKYKIENLERKMSKKILSLDLGITSVGYSVLEELEKDKYSLIDYGVSMFDKPIDKDGKSKKLLHSSIKSTTKLYNLRKQRVKKLAHLFEKYNLGLATELLNQEKENRYPNKWRLRAKKVFEQKLTVGELFTILYLIAKHRGYKSLDSDDLLEELLLELGFEIEEKKSKKDDEKGKIKKALKTIEELIVKNPHKTVAQIIYEEEIIKDNPTFRNHDNYNYMIRRQHIKEEIEKIVVAQYEFGLFENDFEVKSFIKELIESIDDQKDSSNDLSLFGNCQYYPEFKVAHQYSLLSDIFKMYESVSNITLNKTKITKEQIEMVANWFFKKIEQGKNFSEIKYQDIRVVLKLSDEVKIFGKEDYYLDKKGKRVHHTITKFHFLSSLGKIDNGFIKVLFQKANSLEILDEIFDILKTEKSPKTIYSKLTDTFLRYDLIEDKKIRDETVINLIKNKSGKSLNISAYAMRKFIPYFKDGLSTDEIKEKLNLNRDENYANFKKWIKYLHIKNYEKDDNLEINNHPVKYVVSATIRVIKHLHSTYGVFDEIRVESTRELSQNEETKKAIEKANKENEKKFKEILENKEYQKIASDYGKNLKKYARKIILWEEQDKLDIYSGKVIDFDDIFSNRVDIDHIIPQSLGGLSVKHNLVLAHRDENVKKSNQLPMNFIKNKDDFVKRVEYLFSEHKINWKKRKNLLATTLDEAYQDTFESKSLRATSYIEALTAQMLKRYYPFPSKNKQRDGSAVRHIQGRATSNIRKLLGIKSKVRNTNIHHAIDAILIGLTNHSWLQKLSNTFRENIGVIDDEARAKIKKQIPIIEGIEPKELVELIESVYNIYGEESIFYKDIFGNTKSINFWVSKKPMSSKIHKDTIYAKKPNGIFTVREDIIKQFVGLKVTVKTEPKKFIESFEKKIANKIYVCKINPKDIICQIIKERAKEIELLLKSFVTLNHKDKEQISQAKEKLDTLIHKPLIDNNGNIIRKVKFYQTNLTGFDIRGGLAVTEKTFIGFKAIKGDKKIEYKRVDASNFQKIKKENDGSFKVYKNDIVFFIFSDATYKGGRVVSFLEDKKIVAFSNPRFAPNAKSQPISFVTIFKGEPYSHKQHSINKAIGIIKINLDILGNIKSYQKFGEVSKEIEAKILHME